MPDMNATGWSEIRLELDLHRHFAAPREAVYQAFVDEDQFAAWFGPAGCSVPRESVSVDARVGGHRRFTMVTQNGSLSLSVDMTLSEVIENRLLAGHEEMTGFPGADGMIGFTLRLGFVDEGDGTRLELLEGPYSIEMEATAREGWLQSFAKLDALLAR